MGGRARYAGRARWSVGATGAPLCGDRAARKRGAQLIATSHDRGAGGCRVQHAQNVGHAWLVAAWREAGGRWWRWITAWSTATRITGLTGGTTTFSPVALSFFPFLRVSLVAQICVLGTGRDGHFEDRLREDGGGQPPLRAPPPREAVRNGASGGVRGRRGLGRPPGGGRVVETCSLLPLSPLLLWVAFARIPAAIRRRC